jgi:hypothetical protein
VEWRSIQEIDKETRGKETSWKTRHRLKDNNEMDFQGVGCEGIDCTGLAQNTDSWRTLVDAVTNVRVK